MKGGNLFVNETGPNINSWQLVKDNVNISDINSSDINSSDINISDVATSFVTPQVLADNSKSSPFIDNDMISIIIQIILNCLFFFALFYIINYLFNYMLSGVNNKIYLKT
jgi:hypothetical protein